MSTFNNDLIRRSDVLKGKEIHYSFNGVEIIVGEAIPVEYINNIPSVDVQEVKRAHWIISRMYWNGGSEIAEVYCSRCKNNPSLKKPDCILPNYCDNCGSYMARNKDDLEKEKDNAEVVH